MVTSMISTTQSVIPKVDYSRLTILKTCEFPRFRKQKNRVTENMTKKECHALVNTQMRRFLDGENRDTRPKKAKNSSKSSVTSIKSSNIEE